MARRDNAGTGAGRPLRRTGRGRGPAGDRADQPGRRWHNTDDPSQTSEGRFPSDPGPVPGPLPEGFACRPGGAVTGPATRMRRLEQRFLTPCAGVAGWPGWLPAAADGCAGTQTSLRLVLGLQRVMTVGREPSMDPGAWALWPWRLRAACREVDSAVFFSPTASAAPPGRSAKHGPRRSVPAAR